MAASEAGALRFQTHAHQAFVELRGVSHRYKDAGPAILSQLSFSIQQGEIVALVGRSGAGKSTLLNILAGLRRPKSGDVVIGGERVQGPLPSRILMAQQPALFPWMTVAQNVGLGLRFTGQKIQQRERVAEALASVDLSAFSTANVQDLSGGQQQRVALARALAPGPSLLLLDEPFSALDMILREQLQGLVRSLSKSRGLTVVVVTHDLAEAALIADRVVVLPSTAAVGPVDIPITVDEGQRMPAHSQIKAFGERIAETMRRLERCEASLASAQL
ncbi:MAG: ABC transporter ATP-binding protein [Beijerinckiaceae bacterium]